MLNIEAGWRGWCPHGISRRLGKQTLSERTEKFPRGLGMEIYSFIL